VQLPVCNGIYLNKVLNRTSKIKCERLWRWCIVKISNFLGIIHRLNLIKNTTFRRLGSCLCHHAKATLLDPETFLLDGIGRWQGWNWKRFFSSRFETLQCWIMNMFCGRIIMSQIHYFHAYIWMCCLSTHLHWPAGTMTVVRRKRQK
jgi:hypothetical protein